MSKRIPGVTGGMKGVLKHGAGPAISKRGLKMFKGTRQVKRIVG